MNDKLFILFILCFIFTTGVYAAPSISSIEVVNESEGIINLHGAEFGTRTDNNSDASYLPRLWDDFESGNFNNWMFRADGTSWEVRNPTGDSRYSGSRYAAHKLNASALDSMQIRPESRSEYYTSFWMYLASDVNIDNNNKYFRAGSTESNTNLIWNSNYASRNTLTTVEFAEGGTKVDYGSQSLSALKGAWNFVEIMWGLPVLGNSNNYVQIYVNGQLANELSGENGLWRSGEEMTKSPYISLGTWFSGTHGIGGGWYYDDVYIDYTRARVVMGNAAVYSNCTHFEMQVPTAWSDGRITVEMNRGSFGDNESVYLFVVDADNSPSRGYPVNLEDAVSPPSAPALH
jgi:hypothetical protein